MENGTLICGGGLTINTGSYLRPQSTTNIQVGGDWNLLGGTGNANLYPSGTPTLNITFNGGKTAEAPQLIYNSNGSEIFGSGTNVANVTVTGTYVKLNTPVEIKKTLTLGANAIVETSAATLTITNSAAAALSGGSATAYINGAVTKSIAAGENKFPMGKGEEYLPITFNSSAAATLTVEAILGDCGGTPDMTGETPVFLLDDTKYWKVTATSETTLSDIVIAPTVLIFDKTVASNTLNGTYSVSESISGTDFYFTFASTTPPPAEINYVPEEGVNFGTLTVQDKGQNTVNITGKYLFRNLTIKIEGEDAAAFTLVGSLNGILEIPYRNITAAGGTNIGVVFNIDKALANKTYTATLVIRSEDLDSPIRIPLTGTMNVSSTGLTGTGADNATAYIADGVLHINNLSAGERYGIYTLSGQQIAAGISGGANIDINLERKGVYIVLLGGKAVKVNFF
jgi:hypothetical protein